MSSKSILNRYMYDGASVFSQKASSFKGNRVISFHLRLTNLFKQMPRNVRKSRKFCTPVIIITVCSPGPSDRKERRVCGVHWDGAVLRVAESRRCGATSCAGCRIDYQAHGRTDALRDQSRTKWRRGNKYFTVIPSLRMKYLDSFLPPGTQLRGRQCSNVGSLCLHTE